MDNPNVKKVIIVLGIVLTLFAAAKTITELKSMSYIGKTVPMNNTISVSGKGEVVATPDIATFSFGVTEESASVADAQKAATEKMNSILDYVNKSGVEEKDVKTTSYDIYPRYDYVKYGVYSNGKQTLAAYVVSQTIEIKVRKLEEAGKLLSGIGEFGATNISGLSFSQDNQDALVREARDKAIKDARDQAKALAKSLGVNLGDIISFYENQGYPSPMYYAKGSAMGMGGGEIADSARVPSGENKIISNVTITYEIK